MFKMMQKNLEKVYLQIRTDRFYFLKFILEAYDGLAILSSSGVRKNIVIVKYPKELRKDIFALLSELAKQISPYATQNVKHT